MIGIERHILVVDLSVREDDQDILLGREMP